MHLGSFLPPACAPSMRRSGGKAFLSRRPVSRGLGQAGRSPGEIWEEGVPGRRRRAELRLQRRSGRGLTGRAAERGVWAMAMARDVLAPGAHRKASPREHLDTELPCGWEEAYSQNTVSCVSGSPV